MADPDRARRESTTLFRFLSSTLSTQVLSEFYVVASRKFDPPIPRRAARSGARRLLSEDLQAGRRIRGLTIENPFA